MCWLEGQGRDGVPSAVLVVWWLCSWCFAFIVPGEGGESDGSWTHSAVSQAPAEHVQFAWYFKERICASVSQVRKLMPGNVFM